MALTETEIKRAALPKGKTMLKVYDRESRGDVNGVPGLLLLITESGSKLWKLKYRIEGKEKQLALGEYPAVDLKAARKAALAKRELIDKGIDPMAKIDTTGTEQADTFKVLALKWHSKWSADKAPNHAACVLRRLQDHFDAFGNRPVDSIEAPDIVALITKIEQRGASDVAKRAHNYCDQIFQYAIAHGKAKRNPAKDFRPSVVLAPTVTKHIARVSAEELPALLVAIEKYTADNALTGLAVQLLAHTFVRTSELRFAEWSEISFDNAEWRIPAHRMKMRDAHIVLLSTQAVAILRQLEKLTGKHKLVFAANKAGDKPISENTILKALKLMGYQYRMTGHGWRGLASTILHEQQWPHEHIELQLAHRPHNTVSAAYNFALYLPQRRTMLQAWSDYLDKQLAKGKTEKAA
jgi:integrase